MGILAGIGGALVVGFAALAFLAAVVLFAIVVSNGCQDYDLSEEEEEDLCDDGLPGWGRDGLRADSEDWEYGEASRSGTGEGDSEADLGLVGDDWSSPLEAEQRVGVHGSTDDSPGTGGAA